MNKKGFHLYSGGLDSLLSAKLLLDQGIDLVGLHFILPFFPPDFDPNQSAPARRAKDIGLPLRFIRCDREYMRMATNPPHGFGSQMNPCIDCKIFFMREAAEIMRAEGGAFVSTGEVMGQRPMSQMKNTMHHIIHETGLEGRLLRPLSALLLPETDAEREGVVDRSKLLDINGRGRHRQMELAAQWGITDYAAPAGGCLFTDPNIARRIKDLYAHEPNFEIIDMYLLSVGRHYRMNDRVRFVVPRNEEETKEIEKYKDRANLYLYPEFSGPTVWVHGEIDSDAIPLLVSIIARYGKPDKGPSRVVWAARKGKNPVAYEAHEPVADEILNSMRI